MRDPSPQKRDASLPSPRENQAPPPIRPRRARYPAILAALTAFAAIASCSPTVEVKAPQEPITINLNIKLDADVRLRIEEKAKEDVKSQAIF